MRKHLGFLVVLATTFGLGSAASAGAAEWRQPFEHGSSGVLFTDAAGATTERPFGDEFTVYPGMAPRRTTVSVSNTGGRPATYTIQTTPDERSTALAGRLVVAMHDHASGAIAYDGPLDRVMVVGGHELTAGERDRFDVTVSWPSAPDDDRFQGLATSFTLIVRSEAA
jgi:hypothetical protein